MRAVSGGGIRPIRMGLLLQTERDPEHRTTSGCAANRNSAAHELDQLFGNGQAQAGAAILARGRGIRLGEVIENSSCFLFRQTDARIDHLKQYGYLVVLFFQAPGGQMNTTLFGKFDRIRQQVGQYLLQPPGITAEQGRQFG